ncbi:hypothetical protein G3A44_19315 [Ideonella sp. TBM-1]|uniref:N-acyl amino acid synthase FeeM catalytic core domain-containing protein n=1 Tax=Ideonella livida TaxID=2707176 RepID=A0A7C9TNK0_9BURK|nr:hypothetical protein [Ideonella livida]
MSFHLHPCQGPEDLAAACAVRAEAYGRRLPDWRQALAEADALDLAPETLVLLCRDKASGRAVGTARMQFSHQGPLMLEASVELPAHLRQQARAEVTRLAVMPDADAQVRLALMKATWLVAEARGLRWLVIGARRAALIRIYQRIGFANVWSDDHWVPLAHAGQLPHRILSLDVAHIRREWAHRDHPLLGFMTGTDHPDIDLQTPALPASAWPLAA